MKSSMYYGIVTSVVDDANGNRIRAKLPIDKVDRNDKGEIIYPYAFPLLPKTFQTMPKVGETVIVFLVKGEDRFSERFYVGPIISQYQYMDEDKSHALSLLDISSQLPKKNINQMEETFGSFPTIEDVALVGRKGEDIIIKEDEINIRCGARNNALTTVNNKDFFGNILFNGDDLGYIQMKYQRSASKNQRSLINIVGGKINLMNNQDSSTISNVYMKNLNNVQAFNKERDQLTDDGITSEELGENEGIYNEPDYNEMINKLHQLPYGDVLVTVLTVIRTALLNHTHKLGDDEPPIIDGVPCMSSLKTWGQACDETKAIDLASILLSDTVRIS